METRKGNTELRSEKVRSIVGKMPPALLRYGITVIAAALAVAFAVASFLPYRETVKGEGEAYVQGNGKGGKGENQASKDKGSGNNKRGNSKAKERNPVYAVCYVDGSERNKVQAGQAAELRSREGETYTGRVKSISPYAEQTDRYRVEIALGTYADPRLLLKRRYTIEIYLPGTTVLRHFLP